MDTPKPLNALMTVSSTEASKCWALEDKRSVWSLKPNIKWDFIHRSLLFKWKWIHSLNKRIKLFYLLVSLFSASQAGPVVVPET